MIDNKVYYGLVILGLQKFSAIFMDTFKFQKFQTHNIKANKSQYHSYLISTMNEACFFVHVLPEKDNNQCIKRRRIFKMQ